MLLFSLLRRSFTPIICFAKAGILFHDCLSLNIAVISLTHVGSLAKKNAYHKRLPSSLKTGHDAAYFTRIAVYAEKKMRFYQCVFGTLENSVVHLSF